MNFVDPLGLEKWDWDGKGDTSVCEYYDKLVKENPDCGYFKEAASICRSENSLVNSVTNSGIFHAWVTDRTDNSQSEIYDSIRQKLIFYDMQSRQSEGIDENGCTCGDIIDFYHDQAFEESGLSQWFYGGNL